MHLIRKTPILRALYRHYVDITKPAPLFEFTDYDQYWESRIHDGRIAGVLDRHRIIAKLISDGESVLDVGCGEGAFLKYIKQNKPHSRLLGVDVSAVAISHLQTAGIEGLRIDPSKPLAEQTGPGWDVVVLMEVIEHVVDSESLLKQAMSLRPKRILVTIPNVGFLKHRLRLMFGGRFPITSIFYHMKEHVRFWTVKDFHQWAEHYGLRVRSYHGQADSGDKLVRWLAHRFPALLADRLVYELVPAHETTQEAP